MTAPQRNHVKFAGFPVILLLLLQLLDPTSSLLLQYPASTVSVRRPIPFQQQSTCLCSVSVADNVDESLSEEPHTLTASDWDEQFEELQMFMSEYGHCNFPQNPSTELEQKYPRLKTFCDDQRSDYSRVQVNCRHRNVMKLPTFDRHVRFCRLEELGFEFDRLHARWFDRYHELLQHCNENGFTKVTYKQDFSLSMWVNKQRDRFRNKENPHTELQIKLLDDIQFEWDLESAEELWNAKYKELVAFRKTHGHLLVPYHSPQENWIRDQRRRRKKAALTGEQIRLLDEIEFPWTPERTDIKWHVVYDELKLFQTKHGHCSPRQSRNKKLYLWCHRQRKRHQNGTLSTERIKLLKDLGFSFEQLEREWEKMYRELTEYSNAHGHLRVNQDDYPELHSWMNAQRKRYHATEKRAQLTDDTIEKLEEIHFCWSVDWRDRTWHEKYTEVAEFFKEHGHVRVTKKENPSLYNWIRTQGKRYKKMTGQKPLSDGELEMLEQIEFSFLDGQPRMMWNAMYASLVRYREDNDGHLPISHRDDAYLNRWVRQQRHRYRSAYGYVPLSETQKELLDSIDFPIYPKGDKLKRWYEKYDEVVEYRRRHGHIEFDRREDKQLYNWVRLQRQKTGGNADLLMPLPKLQLYQLEQMEFTWTSERFEIEWQKNYDAVLDFFEAHGHCPTMSDNSTLGKWLQKQRAKHRGARIGLELSEDKIQKLKIVGCLK